MKIAVSRIEEEELFSLEEDVSAASWDMDSYDVHFTKYLHIASTFQKAGREVLVDVNVHYSRLITCSRCLAEVEQQGDYNFMLNYSLDSLGKELDINPQVREQILLRFPMKVLCKDDCKGICPGCGVNLNITSCICKKGQ